MGTDEQQEQADLIAQIDALFPVNSKWPETKEVSAKLLMTAIIERMD